MDFHPVLERLGRFLEAKPLISDDVYVASNATIPGCGSIIGASVLITKGTRIPPGSLVLGSPGEVVRTLTPSEQQGIEELAEKYAAVAKHYGRVE
jgi:carbonic anhydrase/acetyltransferase-like protein (isoleucine patch superfamily)